MSKSLRYKVGFGTFPLANPFGVVNEAEAEKIFRAYIQAGGQYVDTAPTYAFGEVENIIGRIVKKIDPQRRYLSISSMCGHALDENKQFKKSGKYKDVIASCEGSLRRLQIDYLDYYISHTPDTETPFEETVSAMAELKKQGKIRNIGVSNVSLDQLKIYNSSGQIGFVENRFSMLNRNFSKDFLDYCETHNIGIIGFQIIERGLLTDRVLEGITLREGDLRLKKPEFAKDIASVIGLWVKDSLKPIADGLGLSISGLALWWAMQQPSMAICLTGATKQEQLQSTLEALKVKADPNIVKRIDDEYQKFEKKILDEYSKSVRSFMGLDQVTYKSPSGK